MNELSQAMADAARSGVWCQITTEGTGLMLRVKCGRHAVFTAIGYEEATQAKYGAVAHHVREMAKEVSGMAQQDADTGLPLR